MVEWRRRKPCFGVKYDVVRGRHFAVLEHLGCVFAVLLSAPPLGNIEMRTRFVDIVLNEPGCGGDKAVPRPQSLVAMTITTQPEKRVTRLRGVPLWFGELRWIRVVPSVWNDLHQAEQTDSSQQVPGELHSSPREPPLTLDPPANGRAFQPRGGPTGNGPSAMVRIPDSNHYAPC